MKLSFSKNDELEVSVKQKVGEDYRAFNYTSMIKSLIENKMLDEPEINGEFSDSERASILSMITHINNEVSEFYNEEDAQDE
ncbi:MAG: hypothetical protein ABW086_11185 [Sedimenticola sp.]